MGNRRSTFLHFSKIIRWRLTKVESATGTKGGWVFRILNSTVSLVPWLTVSTVEENLAGDIDGDGAGQMTAMLTIMSLCCDLLEEFVPTPPLQVGRFCGKFSGNRRAADIGRRC